MSAFTLDEFRRIVELTLGDAEADSLSESSLDTQFEDLGYDSLAVYEMVVRIQDDYPVTISDEELDGLKTPAALIAHVDGALAAAAA
ncbi:acyl carrier protein [Streptacidiphilus jiangxiensis]|uniref:Act minimal PKS acyl carrier protein/aromatase n=1 Tax=Streptacidiphilus jiangxiensis TaxID=235985 RepID=A0A1H7JLT0_STRJI|nr:acyl carrier protein [Streptacidiphilus jiangxiensis]SEK75603.1 act minimal PKS acyl carrier protein/aromatase [Streptacidiphilus jiangxiensis]